VSRLIDAGAAPWRWLFQQTANPAQYVAQGSAPVTVLAFIRGVRAEDLFASATQQDVACVIDAAEFARVLPPGAKPARYDRVRTGTVSYTVEEWRGSPNDAWPVFYKLLLRGATL